MHARKLQRPTECSPTLEDGLRDFLLQETKLFLFAAIVESTIQAVLSNAWHVANGFAVLVAIRRLRISSTT